MSELFSNQTVGVVQTVSNQEPCVCPVATTPTEVLCSPQSQALLAKLRCRPIPSYLAPDAAISAATFRYLDNLGVLIDQMKASSSISTGISQRAGAGYSAAVSKHVLTMDPSFLTCSFLILDISLPDGTTSSRADVALLAVSPPTQNAHITVVDQNWNFRLTSTSTRIVLIGGFGLMGGRIFPRLMNLGTETTKLEVAGLPATATVDVTFVDNMSPEAQAILAALIGGM